MGVLLGQWYVVLGIVKVGFDLWVDLLICLVCKMFVWLVGELYSYIEYLDGGVMVGEVIVCVCNFGCEFLLIIDYNVMFQNYICFDDLGILVIDGMELISYWGYMNFYGFKDLLDDWWCYIFEDVLCKMVEVCEKGVIIVVNYLFQNFVGGCWQCGFDVLFDVYEIWNGNWVVYNEQVFVYWQDMLV